MAVNIYSFPKCPDAGCEGEMVPFEDVSPNGQTAFLKGWACPSCRTNLILQSGSFIIKKVKDWSDQD